MSDHDEPTEPSAPVTAHVGAAGEPDAPGEGGPPKPSLFAAVNARRVSIALVVIALVWLGVWAYSSNSTATSSSVTTTPAAPAATVPARGPRHHRGKGATTTLAPPPNLARTPQAYASALIADWLRHDSEDAYRVATVKAVHHVFQRVPFPNEQMTPQGCRAAARYTACTWVSYKRRVVLLVQGPTASIPVRVVGVTFTKL